MFAAVCSKKLCSLKIKGRGFLTSGVTYSNQGLLIEIISQAFLIWWDGPFKAWNGFYCYIKLLKIIFIQNLSPKKSSTFKILFCWILLWCVKLKSQEYGFPHKMTCIHVCWTVRQHLSGQLNCYGILWDFLQACKRLPYSCSPKATPASPCQGPWLAVAVAWPAPGPYLLAARKDSIFGPDYPHRHITQTAGPG